MFYYLIYNSSFIKSKLFDNEEAIKIIIYGSIAYIICHCILYSNSLFTHFKSYFWLLLTLDITCIYLLFNGTLNGKLSIKTKVIDTLDKKEIDNIFKELPKINKNNENLEENIKEENIKDDNLVTENNNLEENIKGGILENENNENNENLNNFNDIENIKMEIKESLISKNKIINDSESELGSDIDIDGFESNL